jgi:fatty-acid desaturase
MTTRQAVHAPRPADIQPVAHESLDRTLTGLVTALPMLALAFAAWRSWEGLLHASDLLVLGILNSICHVFGRRRFATKDESRNVLWLSLFSFGESWHNNHHAFPTSARHGLRPWELDPSALVIRALAACGLAWDVVGVSPDRQARKLRAHGT